MQTGDEEMFLNELKSKNVRLTINEEEEKAEKCSGDDCYIEVIIQSSFIREIIISSILLSGENITAEVPFTAREKEVLKDLSRGLRNAQIAKRLNISVQTAKVHIKNIFDKIGAKDRTEAVVKAIKNNWINIYEEDEDE